MKQDAKQELLLSASCYESRDESALLHAQFNSSSSSSSSSSSMALLDGRCSENHHDHQRPTNAEITQGHRCYFYTCMIIGTILQLSTFGLCETWYIYGKIHEQDMGRRERFVERVLYIIANFDTFVYFFAGAMYIAALTKPGNAWIMKYWNISMPKNSTRIDQRKRIFCLGIACFAGLVIGSWVGWVVIDGMAGFPAPIINLTLIALANLIVYYNMIACYEWGHAGLDENDPHYEQSLVV